MNLDVKKTLQIIDLLAKNGFDIIQKTDTGFNAELHCCELTGKEHRKINEKLYNVSKQISKIDRNFDLNFFKGR